VLGSSLRVVESRGTPPSAFDSLIHVTFYLKIYSLKKEENRSYGRAYIRGGAGVARAKMWPKRKPLLNDRISKLGVLEGWGKTDLLLRVELSEYKINVKKKHCRPKTVRETSYLGQNRRLRKAWRAGQGLYWGSVIFTGASPSFIQAAAKPRRAAEEKGTWQNICVKVVEVDAEKGQKKGSKKEWRSDEVEPAKKRRNDNPMA